VENIENGMEILSIVLIGEMVEKTFIMKKNLVIEM
jgi:hypothetical protein